MDKVYHDVAKMTDFDIIITGHRFGFHSHSAQLGRVSFSKADVEIAEDKRCALIYQNRNARTCCAK